MIVQDIDFGNGRKARALLPNAATEAAQIISALSLVAPRMVLLIFGGASYMDASLETEITAAFREVILPFAVQRGAVMIDGGTCSGIMKIVGRVGMEQTPPPRMIGIAPNGAVTYPGKTTRFAATAMEAEAAATEDVPLDPNHSHFVLTRATEWGSETNTLFAVAGALSRLASPPVPILALLFNGGAIATKEAARCVRQNWPLIVLRGTGRLADAIAQAQIQPDLAPQNAMVAEIAASPYVRVVALHEIADALS